MKLWVLNKLRFLYLLFQYINALAHKNHWALFGKLEDNPYQNIYIYIYIYVWVFVCSQENKVSSRLSLQWLCCHITLLTLLVEHTLVHWYKQCVTTVYHVPKCMSCHKTIVVITRRAHCFDDYIYILYYAHLASVRFDHSVFCGSVMTAEIYISTFYALISTC